MQVSPRYGLGRAGSERRLKVALLQDFLRVGLVSLAVLSSCISSLSVPDCSSAGFSVRVVGDRESIRGDFCAGPEIGLLEERFFDVRGSELTYERDASQ